LPPWYPRKRSVELQVLPTGKTPVKAPLVRTGQSYQLSDSLLFLLDVVTEDPSSSSGRQDEGAENLD
jgi:hypothetical protein